MPDVLSRIATLSRGRASFQEDELGSLVPSTISKQTRWSVVSTALTFLPYWIIGIVVLAVAGAAGLLWRYGRAN